MSAADTAALIAEARELLPLESIEYAPEHDYIAHLADALEEADIIITEAKFVNAAPHANTKQSNSRMTAVESVLARWNPVAS